MAADEAGSTGAAAGGSGNACLQASLDNAPAKPGEKVLLKPSQVVDPSLLLPAPSKGENSKAEDPAHRGYVHYPGSLTTPPCTETVDCEYPCDFMPQGLLQNPLTSPGTDSFAAFPIAFP